MHCKGDEWRQAAGQHGVCSLHPCLSVLAVRVQPGFRQAELCRAWPGNSPYLHQQRQDKPCYPFQLMVLLLISASVPCLTSTTADNHEVGQSQAKER